MVRTKWREGTHFRCELIVHPVPCAAVHDVHESPEFFTPDRNHCTAVHDKSKALLHLTVELGPPKNRKEEGKWSLSAVYHYHWQELPQVSFSSRQKFCRNKHVFIAPKHVFCRDKSMLVATKLLSRQTYFCHNSFVLTSLFLSQQTCVCRDKRHVLSWQNLSQQT